MGCIGAILFVVVLGVAALLWQVPYVGPILTFLLVGGMIWVYVAYKRAPQPEGERRATSPGRRPQSTHEQHVPPMPPGAAVEPWSNSAARLEVVGEAYRGGAFLAIFQGLPIRSPEGAELRLPAALVPDPTNPYDHNAVAIRVANQHVGYIDRDAARVWHPRLAALAAEGQHLVVPARLWAAQRGTRVNARVTLFAPPPEHIRPANQLPTQPHVVLPTGSAVQVTREEDHMDVLARWAEVGDVPIAMTLHAIHEIRPRSSFETVEVQLDGERVGILTPQQAANLLPLVKFIDARRLVPVARATLRGNALKADVTLHVAKAQEVDPQWLNSLGPELPAEPRVERGTYDWDDDQP